MVNGKFSRLLFCITIVTPLLFPLSSQAQNSFVVAGTLDFYTDFVSVLAFDHSFAATVYYNPAAAPSGGSSGLASYEETLFENAVASIDFTLYDGAGNMVQNITEDGMTPVGKSTYIRARNDLSGVGGDELEYNSFSLSDNHQGRVIFLFLEENGYLIDDLLNVPEPPGTGDFQDAPVEIEFLFSNGPGQPWTGGFGALGRIQMVMPGETDPYEECAEQASSHGQYVSCVSHLNNLLRANGEITGQEKGQRQQEVAKSKSK